MGAVRSSEGVVHVHVGQLRERRRQLGVIPGLARLVADVLEHQDLARREVLREGADVLAHHSGSEGNVGIGELRQPVGHRSQR